MRDKLTSRSRLTYDDEDDERCESRYLSTAEDRFTFSFHRVTFHCYLRGNESGGRILFLVLIKSYYVEKHWERREEVLNFGRVESRRRLKIRRDWFL